MDRLKEKEIRKQVLEAEEKQKADYFKQKREMLLLSLELDTKKHKLKMRELEFQRESDRLRHENDMEKQRVKTAEIRKDREWRQQQEYARLYK
jgi:hypothetical protein